MGEERPRNLNLFTLQIILIRSVNGQCLAVSVLGFIVHKFHLMIKFLSECGKGPKKPFAPPAQKLHSLMPYSPNSPKGETLGISSQEAEARPNLLKARLEKKAEKATTENGASSGQEDKVKAQDNKQAKKEKVSVLLLGSRGTVSSSHLPRTNRIFSCWGNSPCSFSFLFFFFLTSIFFFFKRSK